MLHKIGMFRHSFPLRVCGMLLLLLLFALPAGLPVAAHADDSATSTTCAKQLKSSNTTPGTNIVNSVFAAVNAVLSKIGQAMYKGIVSSTSFTNVVNVTLSLYIAVYGFMVMTNMAPKRMGEVAGRLIRVAIVYGLLGFSATGWTMFDQYISAFFLGGMNELIFNFAVAAGVPVLPPAAISGSVLGVGITAGVGITPSLDPGAVQAIYGPMNLIFQPFYIFAVIGMFFLNVVCALMAAAMVWAFWDFTLMIVGCLITYVKAVVGLTFLFGIAPFFIICLLFQRTRQLFLGWISQCVAFAITPVLLFAFLSFYTVLLMSVLNSLFTNVDFCWGKMMSPAGTTTDINWWRPALYKNGSWQLINGSYTDNNGVDLAPPFNIVNVLLFVIVAHLGKNFAGHIEEIAGNVSGGIGLGITTGEQVGTFINNKVTGGKGISSLIGGAFKTKAPSAAANMATNRTGPG